MVEECGVHGVVGSETGLVKALTDCFTGNAYHVFSNRYPVGSIVECGEIINGRGGQVECDSYRCLVIGYADMETVEALLGKANYPHPPLQRGIWHKVFAE